MEQQKKEVDLLEEELIESEEEISEIPQEIRKINTQAYDKSVSDVVRMIEDGDIHLNPEYQRNYIWDNKKASMLIESIILNVPIPVIYVSQEADDSWTVIDGLQRLNSLYRYFERDFKLNGLEILKDLNKSDVKSLNPKALRVLKNGLLRIIVISNDSHPEIKYDVFMRLNRGSVKLNEQELRNCLYRGSFNELLKSLANNKNILSLLNLSEPHKRMVDCEIILRYIALSNNWIPEEGIIKGYKGRMKTFLNECMQNNQDEKPDIITKIEKDFENSMEKVVEVFGDKAFRRINEKGEHETNLNRAVIDVVSVPMKYFSLEVLKKNKKEIIKSFKNLSVNNYKFRDSLIIGTSDTKVATYRLNEWYSVLKNITNGSI